jgi:hypothetical protein
MRCWLGYSSHRCRLMLRDSPEPTLDEISASLLVPGGGDRRSWIGTSAVSRRRGSPAPSTLRRRARRKSPPRSRSAWRACGARAKSPRHRHARRRRPGLLLNRRPSTGGSSSAGTCARRYVQQRRQTQAASPALDLKPACDAPIPELRQHDRLHKSSADCAARQGGSSRNISPSTSTLQELLRSGLG